MPMFSVLAGDHSTKSSKWGHLIPFAPLSASGDGKRPLCPPAPPPMRDLDYQNPTVFFPWLPFHRILWNRFNSFV